MKFGLQDNPFDSLMVATAKSFGIIFIANLSVSLSFTCFILMGSPGRCFNYLTQAAVIEPKFEHFPEFPAELQAKILELAGNATAMSKTNKGFRHSYQGDDSDPSLKLCYLENYLLSAIKAQASIIAKNLSIIEIYIREIELTCGYLLRKPFPRVAKQLVSLWKIAFLMDHPEDEISHRLIYQLDLLLYQAIIDPPHTKLEEQDSLDARDLLAEIDLRPAHRRQQLWFMVFRLAYAGKASHLVTLLDDIRGGLNIPVLERLPEDIRMDLLTRCFLPIFEQFPEVLTDSVKNSLEAYVAAFEAEDTRLRGQEAVDELFSPQNNSVDHGEQELTFDEIDALIENWDFSFEGAAQHTHTFPELIMAILSDSEIYRTGCQLHDAVNALIRKGPYQNREEFAEADRLLKKILHRDGSIKTRLMVINGYHKIYEQLNRLPLIYS